MPARRLAQTNRHNANTINPHRSKQFIQMKPCMNRFDIWDMYSEQWSNRITHSPILLTIRDVHNWKQFRVNKLQQQQLYLWRASKDEWVPMWSLKNGFLLKNRQFIPYNQITYEILISPKWVKNTMLPTDPILQLLSYFNIRIDRFLGTHLNTPQKQQQQCQHIAGFPHYSDGTHYQPQLPLYQNDTKGWGKHCIFSQTGQRFNYEFVVDYHCTYHQSTTATGKLMVASLPIGAAKGIKGRSYIYQEKDIYIPFYKIDDDTIRTNNGHFIRIGTLQPELDKNDSIMNDKHNCITKQQYDLLIPNLRSLFINFQLMKFKIDFILNYHSTIPYRIWSRASKIDQISSSVKDSQTLFLLSPDGLNGFPIGVQPASKQCIILNSGKRQTIAGMQKKFQENKIKLTINLDFNGFEPLYDSQKQELHQQLQPPVQQMVSMDISKLQKVSVFMQSHMAGQYILLDFGMEHVMPIYVLNDQYFRTPTHIVHILDLPKFVTQYFDNTNAILKSNVSLDYNYVQLSSQDIAVISNDQNSQQPFALPILNNNNKNDLPSTQQQMVNNAANAAHQHTHDIAQFNVNLQQMKDISTKNPKAGQSNPSNNRSPQQTVHPPLQPLQTIHTPVKSSIDKQKTHQTDHNNNKSNQNTNWLHQPERVDMIYVKSLSKQEKSQYLLAKLEKRIAIYDHGAVDKAKYLLEFDENRVIAALNDDTYLFKLMDEINDQLEHRKTWSKAELETWAFWYKKPEPKEHTKQKNGQKKQYNKSSKQEVEYSDTELEQEIDLAEELTRIPTEHGKRAYIGTLLYSKLQQTHPHQAKSVYVIMLNYELSDLQDAMFNDDKYNKLVGVAQAQRHEQQRVHTQIEK